LGGRAAPGPRPRGRAAPRAAAVRRCPRFCEVCGICRVCGGGAVRL